MEKAFEISQAYPSEYFSIVWHGYLEIPYPGEVYRFYIESYKSSRF